MRSLRYHPDRKGGSTASFQRIHQVRVRVRVRARVRVRVRVRVMVRVISTLDSRLRFCQGGHRNRPQLLHECKVRLRLIP